jgi:hypothetical protein
VKSDTILFKTLSKTQHTQGSDNMPQHNGWTIVPVGGLAQFENSRKATRVPKLSPGLFFTSPTIKCAIYMDTSHKLIMNPVNIAKLIRSKEDNKNALMVVIRHPYSKTVEHEVSEIFRNAAFRKTITHSPELLQNQLKAYTLYREENGIQYSNVFEGSFIVHNMETYLRQASAKFRCEWYKEYQLWADRDQVSGSFVLDKAAKEVNAKMTNETEWIPVHKLERTGSVSGADETFYYVRLLDHTVYHPYFQRKVNDKTIFKKIKFSYNQ